MLFLWAKKAASILEDKDYWKTVQRPLKGLKLKRKRVKKEEIFLLICKRLPCYPIIRTLLPSNSGVAGWCQRPGESKCVIMRVQFRTGQTGALLTMITGREHWDSIAPSAPQRSAKWLQRHRLFTHCAKETKKRKEEEVRKTDHLDINKARYPSLAGMDSFRSSLLGATAPRSTHTGNNIRNWRDGSWWSLYYEACPILPSSAGNVGRGKQTQTASS